MKLFLLPLSFVLLLSLTGCESKPRITGVPMPSPAQPPASAAPVATTAGLPVTASAPSTAPVTTPSGLRYQVLASGPVGGASPTITDSVTVHYRGTLTDGTVFDSSIDRGEPATFGVGQVIPGWTEALQLMKPGDKFLLYIPSRLAYGPRAMGAKIPANSDLIFQVELLQVIGSR